MIDGGAPEDGFTVVGLLAGVRQCLADIRLSGCGNAEPEETGERDRGQSQKRETTPIHWTSVVR